MLLMHANAWEDIKSATVGDIVKTLAELSIQLQAILFVTQKIQYY